MLFRDVSIKANGRFQVIYIEVSYLWKVIRIGGDHGSGLRDILSNKLS